MNETIFQDKATALANTVPDSNVHSLIRQAYLKGVDDALASTKVVLEESLRKSGLSESMIDNVLQNYRKGVD